MPTLTPKDFAAKWGKIQLKEMTTAQSHFLDVCALIDHPAPLDTDPKGESSSPLKKLYDGGQQ